jgi:hypothetical protein
MRETLTCQVCHDAWVMVGPRFLQPTPFREHRPPGPPPHPPGKYPEPLLFQPQLHVAIFMTSERLGVQASCRNLPIRTIGPNWLLRHDLSPPQTCEARKPGDSVVDISYKANAGRNRLERKGPDLLGRTLVPSFPNSVWERSLGKLCFPRGQNRRETEFRQTAFPNRVWERGVPSAAYAIMRRSTRLVRR